jgi:hypothetical protein
VQEGSLLYSLVIKEVEQGEGDEEIQGKLECVENYQVDKRQILIASW